MDAGPDESGEFTICKIFGGKTCMQVSVDDVRAGDFIEFHRRGMRVRRVKSVHRGRKHNYVQFVPSKYNAFKSQRVNLRDIRSVWRPQRVKRKPELMRRPDFQLETT